jgi:hypothetical protein
VAFCGMNYLMVLHFSGNDGEATHLVQVLPVERRAFYDTFVKMMLAQCGIFAAVFGLGTFFGQFIVYTKSIFPQNIFSHETPYSRFGYYAVLLCLVVAMLIFLVGVINDYTTIKKSMIIIGIIYCVPLWIPFYLLFLFLTSLSPQAEIANWVFAIVSGAALIALIVLFYCQVKKNREKFTKR